MRFYTVLSLLFRATASAAVSSQEHDRGPSRDWNAAVDLATEFVARLNLSDKADFVTGKLGVRVPGCIGSILSVDRLGFRGLCLQDGPAGVNFADLTSVFPSGITVGASWDKDLMFQRGKALGEEFRGKGVNVALGPSSGPLGRNPLGGRNWEGFSPDPYLSGIAMELTIRGIQSQGVQTCAKHLVGNEQETQRSNTVSANGTRIEAISSNIDDRTLHELYLWPFAHAIKAGTTSIMCSYNRVNGTYACENSVLLKQILRDELGFKGFVVSDWFATHSGAKSINAGLDLNMPGFIDQESVRTGNSYWGITNITAMVDAGSVEEQRIDEMVVRIMTPYFYMGQDKAQYPHTDPSLAFSFAAGSNVLPMLPFPYPPSRDVRGSHSELIRKLGAEATVLLKNVNSTLPLSKSANIGVFGNDAADPSDGLLVHQPFEIGTLDIGSGAGSGRHTYLVSPLEAIKARARTFGGRVQHILRNSVLATGDFSSLYPIPDVCLVFLNTYAGENYDRTTYEADWNSTLVVENVASRCPNTVVITHSAGVNTMPWANNPNVTAILAAHLPGQESGNAIVDVLWGDTNPSGRLPYSIPVHEEDIDTPIVNLAETDVTSPTAWQADFVEGLMIDYRRLDAAGVEPLYEFGFGLGYTSFGMSSAIGVEQLVHNLTARSDPARPISPGGNPDLWQNILRVITSVTNTGTVTGAVTPQLYISLPASETPEGTPPQVLRGFEKISLQPGETQQVMFTLTRRDLSYWDVDQQDWVLPDGLTEIRTGLSSRDIKASTKYAVRKGAPCQRKRSTIRQ